MKFTTLMILTCLAFSCSKNDKRMKDKASIEGTSTSQSQIRVENANLTAKAEKMEKDLATRHRFYQAMKGVYEGEIITKDGTYNIRLTFTPSMAPMNYNRVRQLEEIAADLNNLTINAQILQWDPSSDMSAIACRVSGIRPDLEKGSLDISTESCPNLYRILITEKSYAGSRTENIDVATQLSREVLNGRITSIDSLNGSVQPSTNAAILKFEAVKVQE